MLPKLRNLVTSLGRTPTIEEYTAEDASRRETVVRLAARIRELKAAQALKTLEKPSPCSVLLL